MSADKWIPVTKSNPCPACGKGDWCAYTPDDAMLKCERTSQAPPGWALVKPKDNGGLFKRTDGSGAPVPANRPGPTRPGKGKAKKVYPTPEAAFEVLSRLMKGELVATWSYPADALRIGRFNLPGTDPETGKQKKTFRPIHSVKGGWSIGDPDGPLPLYRVDQLPDAGPVVVTEGEKCADAAAGVGLAVVTSAHGGGSAHKSDWTPLAGREVISLPDNDETGRKYAQEVAGILNKLTPPAVVKIVNLPDLPDKGDIADWTVADGPAGGKTPEEIRSWIKSLADTAPVWSPPIVSTSTQAGRIVEPYKPFPVECLPEPMRSFVAHAAQTLGCDSAFVALPLLAAAASAIGNTRRIMLKRNWTEPAILWTCIVCESGTTKSPALELAMTPLRIRQQETMKQYEAEKETFDTEFMRYEIKLSDWKKAGGTGEPPKQPQKPYAPRCWCDDVTIEALADLLCHNWRGLLMKRDELAGWLGGFDRYAKGKGGEVAKWLEVHGGRSMIVDRKTGNPPMINVPRAAVSITGSIQPAAMQRALGRDYFENGLAARLLMACPPRRAKSWTDAEIDPVVEDAIDQMFNGLFSIEPALLENGEPEPGIVQLSPEAKTAWVQFFNAHAREHVNLTGDLSAAWSKLEGYAARLALVIHMVRHVSGDPDVANGNFIDTASIASGIALSRWFGYETRRAYAIIGETEIERHRRELVDLIRRHGGGVTVRDLQRSGRAYSTSELAEQALNGLIQAGLGRWVDVESKDTGGRPKRQFVLADTVDVDETPKTPENSGVVSTGPVETDAQPETAIFTEKEPAVDETPEIPEKYEVPSTSTPSTVPQTAPLDPDKPGDTALLTSEQRKRYKAIYLTRPASMSQSEKHARAWRAALSDNGQTSPGKDGGQ